MLTNLDLDGLTPQQQKQAKLRADLAKQDGDIVYEIFTDVNPEYKIRPNVDFNFKEMTSEQREIYDALKEVDDEAYEDLEDDFVLMANEGIVPMRKKEEVAKEIVKATEVEEIKGDQIEAQSFMDIIRQDAKLLGVTTVHNPIIDEDDEYDNEHLDKDLNHHYDDAEEMIKEVKEPRRIDQTTTNDAPADILELMVLNKTVKKGMEVVEQTIETIPGGGKLIFRKVKKVKKVEIDTNVKLDELNEDKLDDMSFEVDSDGEGVTKSELDRLEANYQRLKALKNVNKQGGKSANNDDDHSDYDDEDVELEIVELDGEKLVKYTKSKKRVTKVKYNIKEDLILKHAVMNDSDGDIDLERPTMRKLNAEVCPQAPEDRVKPQNYYCMAVVKEDLDVKRKLISV